MENNLKLQCKNCAQEILFKDFYKDQLVDETVIKYQLKYNQGTSLVKKIELGRNYTVSPIFSKGFRPFQDAPKINLDAKLQEEARQQFQQLSSAFLSSYDEQTGKTVFTNLFGIDISYEEVKMLLSNDAYSDYLIFFFLNFIKNQLINENSPWKMECVGVDVTKFIETQCIYEFIPALENFTAPGLEVKCDCILLLLKFNEVWTLVEYLKKDKKCYVMNHQYPKNEVYSNLVKYLFLKIFDLKVAVELGNQFKRMNSADDKLMVSLVIALLTTQQKAATKFTSFTEKQISEIQAKQAFYLPLMLLSCEKKYDNLPPNTEQEPDEQQQKSIPQSMKQSALGQPIASNEPQKQMNQTG